ncbi:hypothetical protein [Streptomyces sp. TP-A0874]|uniref:hypothetical protein n=1 Tax=Streptomyces sp. TP-A0874 TaxID=549819 RepID=UPI0008538680|nr:hypothetical protein [Streptomyces sp. TP-A0874]
MSSSFHLRAVVAGAMAVGLLGGGAGAAVAAPSAAPHSAVQATNQTTKTNTIKVNHRSVKPGDEVTVHGKVTGIKAGTSVSLEEKQHGKWKTLTETSAVMTDHTYTLKAAWDKKGKKQIRTVVDGKRSEPVTVKVR